MEFRSNYDQETLEELRAIRSALERIADAFAKRENIDAVIALTDAQRRHRDRERRQAERAGQQQHKPFTEEDF